MKKKRKDSKNKLNCNLDANKLGLTLGSFIALLHAVWIFIVNLSWGQAAADLFYYLHFVKERTIVSEFNTTIAISGVLAAFVIGYAAGYVFSRLWNYFNK